MPLSVENTKRLGRRIKITISADRIESMVKKKLMNVAKTFLIDGFRKGKVPLQIVSQRYRTSVLHEVLSTMMHENFLKEVNHHNIMVVGNLNFVYEEYKIGHDFTYSVEFEVVPEINIPPFDTFSIIKPRVEVTEQDVDNMLFKIRTQQAKWTLSAPIAHLWDRVTIDMKCMVEIENEIMEGEEVTDVVLILGQRQIRLDLEKSIIGHRQGEKFFVEIELHPSYSQGRKGFLKLFIFIKHIEKAELTELNEGLIKRFGISGGKISDLRDEVRKNIDMELQEIVRHYIKNQLLNNLLKINKINVPSALVEKESKCCQYYLTKILPGTKKKQLIPRVLLEKHSKQRVAIGLLLNEVIRINNLSPHDHQLTSLMESLTISPERDPSFIKKDPRQNTEIMNIISQLSLEEQILDLILKQAIITEERISYHEMISIIDNERLI
ncbi:MAG: trigger factor [Candidatus Dasytiphilus stammeri]